MWGVSGEVGDGKTRLFEDLERELSLGDQLQT